MTRVFSEILTMSLTASVVIAAVLLARLALRRAPKKFSYVLWLAVAFRLWTSPVSLFGIPVLRPLAGGPFAGQSILVESAVGERERADAPAQTARTPEESPAAEAVTGVPASEPPAGVTSGTSDPLPAAPTNSEAQTVPGGTAQIEPGAVPGGAQAEPGGTGSSAFPGTPKDDPVPAAEDGLPASSGTAGNGQDENNPAAQGSETSEIPGAAVDPTGAVPAGTVPAGTIPAATLPTAADEPDQLNEPVKAAEGTAEEKTDLARLLWDGASWLWFSGVLFMLLYAAASYFRMKRAMSTATKSLTDNGVYESDRIRSPFLLGIVRPRIYLPAGTEGELRQYALAHERFHLRRADPVAKLFAFLLLAAHWFNPLVWLSFALMTRDMEMSCDENVLAAEPDIKKSYSYTLLSFAVGGRFPSPAPLSFGESNVKARIKNALGYKRPKLLVSLLAAVLVLTAAVCCMANPSAAAKTEGGESGAAEEPISGETTSGEQTSDEQTSGEQTSDEQTPDEQTSDEQTSDGQTSDGQTSDGQTSDGQTSDGQTSDGQTDEDSSDETPSEAPSQPESPEDGSLGDIEARALELLELRLDAEDRLLEAPDDTDARAEYARADGEIAGLKSALIARYAASYTRDELTNEIAKLCGELVVLENDRDHAEAMIAEGDAKIASMRAEQDAAEPGDQPRYEGRIADLTEKAEQQRALVTRCDRQTRKDIARICWYEEALGQISEAPYRSLAALPEGELLPLERGDADRADRVFRHGSASDGTWISRGVTADGREITTELVFRRPGSEEAPIRFTVTDTTNRVTLLDSGLGYRCLSGGFFSAVFDPATYLCFKVEAVSGFDYGQGEEEVLVFTLLSSDETRLKPYIGAAIPFTGSRKADGTYPIRSVTAMPDGELLPLKGDAAELRFHFEGLPPASEYHAGAWSNWAETADGRVINARLVFRGPASGDPPLDFMVYDQTNEKYLYYHDGDYTLSDDGVFTALLEPVNNHEGIPAAELCFTAEYVSGFPYGDGSEETLVFTLLSSEEELFKPYVGMKLPFSSVYSMPVEKPAWEREEEAAMKANGLFTRRQALVVTDLLLFGCFNDSWFDGNYSGSATAMYWYFGQMKSRYGDDFPAVFRSMMRPTLSNFAVSIEDLKRIHTEFFGMDESTFYYPESEGRDGMAEVPAIGYSRNLWYGYADPEITWDEHTVTVRFTLIEVHAGYDLSDDGEYAEARTPLGRYEISYTWKDAQGGLPRMRFSKVRTDAEVREEIAAAIRGSEAFALLTSSWETLSAGNGLTYSRLAHGGSPVYTDSASGLELEFSAADAPVPSREPLPDAKPRTVRAAQAGSGIAGVFVGSAADEVKETVSPPWDEVWFSTENALYYTSRTFGDLTLTVGWEMPEEVRSAWLDSLGPDADDAAYYDSLTALIQPFRISPVGTAAVVEISVRG